MTNNFYVYEHWRLDRDECFYVGKGKGSRAYNMSWRNPHHKAVQAKLFRIGSSMEIRIVADGLTEERAFALEIERIAFWKSAGADLTNITTGGEGTAGLAAHNRQQVICLEDGIIYESLTKAAQTYGAVVSEISKVCNLCGPTAANGRHFMYSDANIPEKRRKQIVRKIDLFFAGWRSKLRREGARVEHYRGVIDGFDARGRSAAGPIKNSKPVVCLDDGREFVSASEAARFYDIAKSAVIEMCLGKNGRKQVSGYRFKYMESA